jgi:hypothetical protein
MNVEQFRKRAEECRQLAALKTDPFDREFWLRLAEDWMSVVLEVDKPRRPGSTVSVRGERINYWAYLPFFRLTISAERLGQRSRSNSSTDTVNRASTFMGRFDWG